MKRTFFLVSTCIWLVASCGSESKEGEYVSAVVADDLSEQELKESLKAIEAEEKARIEEEQRSMTSLQFEKLAHDFGVVEREKLNTYKFKVTNTGKAPLIISDVQASCGCTTPHKPEQPIPPGKSDYIEVGFQSKSDQKNEVNKTVTVTANTAEKIHELQIKAFVKW